MTHVDDPRPLPSAESLHCRDVVNLVTDYIEDMLSPVERERIDVHLVECSGCDIYLSQMRYTIRMLEHLIEDPTKRARSFQRWESGQSDVNDADVSSMGRTFS